MKKILTLILALMLLLLCLASCDSSKHEHITGDWEHNEYGHWQPIICNLNTCDLEAVPLLEHVDDNDDNICDVCGYIQTSDTEFQTDSSIPNKFKLVDLEQYSSMTATGTNSIEVVYDYLDDDFTTYEFVIEDQEVIGEIMTEVFSMELKDYPDDRDIDIYQRWIVVKQGSNTYRIDLTLASDGKKQYICQSQKVREIIKKYIEDNLID